MKKILLYVFVATLSILSFKFLNANTSHAPTSDDSDDNDEEEDRTNDQF